VLAHPAPSVAVAELAAATAAEASQGVAAARDGRRWRLRRGEVVGSLASQGWVEGEPIAAAEPGMRAVEEEVER
jgi:hypothetical protein